MIKIECLNGFYKFFPQTASELTLFGNMYEIDLVKHKNFFTFEPLLKISDYSIAGATINGILYNKTYEGKPEEVMLKNKLTFNLANGQIVSALTIVETADITQDQLKFASKNLLQAYAILQKERVLSFNAYYAVEGDYYLYDRIETL